jgi:hypothetical protein
VKPSRFGLFFGIVATVVTLGAIVLAVFAPQLTPTPSLQAPPGWQQVYNDNPSNSSNLWDNTGGCNYPAEGLEVSSDSACVFQPTDGPLQASGVLVVAQLAPAADVPLSQDAGILLDNSVLMIITQQGDYKICEGSCDPFSDAYERVISGSTIAWHADAFIPNEIASLYDRDQGTISFYVNGQFVERVQGDLSASPSIALTTSSSGEALFTHVTIYAG